ncbi:MAG: flagellar assembly protein FliW [bacterium]|jgi:flagellar assembly factor FliW|nr:flagellar assembly protein FliW [bacterium]
MGSPEQSTTKLKFVTARFGEIELAPSDILTFPEGLLGFAHVRRYVLVEEPGQEPFLWMQGIDDPDLAFIVVNPHLFFPGYEIQVKPQELTTIHLTDLSMADVLVIITLPEDPMELTANLRGPVIINRENNFAKQLVLIDDRYHTKHFLLKEIPDYLATPPERKKSQSKPGDAPKQP